MSRVGAGVVVVTLFGLALLGCSEKGKRESFAESLKAKVAKCDVRADGHEADKLSVDCERATMDYVEGTVIPAMRIACPEAKTLKFADLEISGPAGSKKSWVRALSTPLGCKL